MINPPSHGSINNIITFELSIKIFVRKLFFILHNFQKSWTKQNRCEKTTKITDDESLEIYEKKKQKVIGFGSFKSKNKFNVNFYFFKKNFFSDLVFILKYRSDSINNEMK